MILTSYIATYIYSYYQEDSHYYLAAALLENRSPYSYIATRRVGLVAIAIA